MGLNVLGYLWSLDRPASGSDSVEPSHSRKLDVSHSDKDRVRIFFEDTSLPFFLGSFKIADGAVSKGQSGCLPER